MLYTTSLLHLDGTDASTTFTDETGKTWTAVGTAQLDTAQQKFGSASLLLDGNSDYITTPDNVGFYFGTGDFTIEAWIRINTLATQTICGQRQDDDNRFLFYFDNGTATLRFIVTDAASTTISVVSAVSPLSTGLWTHIALVRYGNDFKIFVGGTQSGTTVTDTSEVPNLTTGVFAVGARNVGGTFGLFFDGWMDEFRVSKGIARWTANFTPPAGEYRFVSRPITHHTIGRPV